MTPADRPSHTLTGFPAAATEFVSALESNRRLIAEDAGLTATELRTLFHIARVVSITPKDLAGYLGMTTGAVTAISRSLVEAHLLQRVDHPDDRRSLYLELTGEGHRRMTQIHTDFDAMIAASTSGLSPEDLERFTAALSLVADEVRRRTRRH
ncbi:MarR family winged helix-turn-helix transcriptional regulator [uncultured Amnibacterium sp.]|uniref:MarR family winged helix-turn-helix transcriptional regulator n=1 Tax=uncultured Amnibacterium sp. TaxID=1631851 RepID=UPI0035CC12D1